jgi:hypothetical protein
MGWPLALVLVTLIAAGSFGASHFLESVLPKLDAISPQQALLLALVLVVVVLLHRDLVRAVRSVLLRTNRNTPSHSNHDTQTPRV